MKYGIYIFIALITCVFNYTVANIKEQDSTLYTYSLSAQREKKVAYSDSIFLDSLTILPSSIHIDGLDSTAFRFEVKNSLLLLDTLLNLDSVNIYYRVLPFNLNKPYAKRSLYFNQAKQSINPYKIYAKEVDYYDIFEESDLQKSGNITRGVSFGNARDLSLSSNLNLQLAGKVQDIEILAAISDNNIPIQPDGNTQQLQDFDRVFVQFSKNNHQLIAGDFAFEAQQSNFLKLNKKAQGLSYSGQFNSSKAQLKTAFSAALSRGQFARNAFFGTEGNQGPYQLIGAENEQFIIVLSGTEKVYIDGKLLKRGQDADYIINYNTGEVTFTANQIVTKDKRIVLEFQYTARNYSRTMAFSESEINWKNKTKLSIQLFSEQDMRFQPINQLLSESDLRLLAEVGDSLHLAVKPTARIDSTLLDNALLYQRIDTIIDGDVIVFYRQNNNSNLGIYTLTFSNVGRGKGNYRLTPSSANGRVFRWVPPVNGAPQGNYEPIVQLISPKQQQMAVMQLEHEVKSNHHFFIETALSNNNKNLFSDLHKADDQGIALKTSYQLKEELKNDWSLVSKQQYQFVSTRFNEVERFRTVEFQRDWNLAAQPEENENFIRIETNLLKKGKERVKIQNTLLNRGSFYTGWKNQASANLQPWKNASLKGNISFLSTDGATFNSTFLKHQLEFKQQLNNYYYLFWEEQERNIAQLKAIDSLLSTSINFNVFGNAIGFKNEVFNTQISHVYRTDDLPLYNALTRNTNAHDYAINFSNTNLKNKISFKATYRVMEVVDSILPGQLNENTLLGRVDYRSRWWKGFITSATFYEIGTGNELRRTYSFIEVLPGQGTHTWIDYNGDGKQQINEFEIAQFQDQAQYIRIFLPTNDFVTTFTNQFNHSLSIFPAKILSRDKNWKKLLTRFSNQLTISLNEKNIRGQNQGFQLPFLQNLADTSLISANNNFRNTLFFNRSNPKFGANYTYGKTGGKNLLVNGLEGRSLEQHLVDFRWNFIRQFSLQNKMEYQEKQRESELFSLNEFLIRSYIVEPTLSFQPNAAFRLNLNLSYKQKNNDILFGGQTASYQKIGTGITYAAAGKGRLNIEVDYIQTSYSDENQGNSPVQFELLEGLQVGQNVTWQVRYQQSFQNNLQANFLYEGRSAQNTPTIHTASVQVQLLF